MKLLGSSLSWLVHILIRRWFLLLTLFALYYYHVILDKDMLCSCTSLTLDCWVYLLAPALVLFLVQLWVDQVFSRGVSLLCGGVRGRVAPVLIWRFLEAGFVGLLWVQSVLLDGDWYLCCGRMCCGRGSGYCFQPGDLIYPDDQIKNESQVVGLLFVVLVTLTAAILSCLPFEKCCSSAWPEALLEEVGQEVSLRMRNAARDQVKDKMNGPDANLKKWEELFYLEQKPAETPRVQDTVHVNPLPLRPIPRHQSGMDWGRPRPGLNQDQVSSNQWRN